MPTRDVAAGRHSFDESLIHRDHDGKFDFKTGGGGGGAHHAPDAPDSAGGAPEPPAKGADKLKLHGRIQLDKGEGITGSGRAEGQDEHNPEFAATDGPDGPRLTIAMHDAYDAKWRGADSGDDDEDGPEGARSGLDDGTSVRLNPEQSRGLAEALDTASAEMARAKREQDALWKEIDRLHDDDTDFHNGQVAGAREKLAYAEAGLASGKRSNSPVSWQKQVERRQNELAALENNPPKGLDSDNKARLTSLERRAEDWNGLVLTEGTIEGDWGQIRYQSAVEDDVEYLTFAVLESGSTRGLDQAALSTRMDSAQTKTFAKQLRRVGSTAGMDLGGDVRASWRLKAAASAPLARRDGVELARTGSWAISSGSWEPTAQDFAAAVDAMGCAAIRRPILKLGHTDNRFPEADGDGQPAIGWVENLRIAEGGHSLLGDYAGMPGWLNQVMASAYPSRSVEGQYGFRCQLGHQHPFVITGVALLGVTQPGIGTLRSLDDVRQLYGVAAAEDHDGGGRRVQLTIRAAEAEPVVHTGAMIALIPRAEDAQRLAVDGGENPDELHVTLAYLGKADQIGDGDRQDLLREVTTVFDGFPQVAADAFSIAAFNPPSSAEQPDDERDTCIVLGLSGSDLDVAHMLVSYATDGLATPPQHQPWHAHLTLVYTADLARIAELADRCGPVTFDRVRVAFGDEIVDLPLFADEGLDEQDGAEPWPDEVAAAASPGGDRDQLKRFWTRDPRGLGGWSDKPHPWTSLYRELKKHLEPERARRVAASWYHEVFGRWPGSKRAVHAAGGDPVPTRAQRLRDAWNASGAPHSQWVVEARADAVIVVDDTDRSYRLIPAILDGDQVVFGEPLPYDLEVDRSLVYASAAESRPDPGWSTGAPVITEVADLGALAAENAATAAREAVERIARAQPGSDTGPEAIDSPDDPPAEPDPPTDKEEPIVALSPEALAALGLDDSATDDDVSAAILDLVQSASSTQDEVAASAARADEVERKIAAAVATATTAADQKIGMLTEQLAEVTAHVAAVNAEKAQTIRASVLDTALREGKYAPADREKWEQRYDKAPEVTADVLASIAVGTAVPVQASGYTGDPEPSNDQSIDAEYEALFGSTSTQGA